MFTPQMFSLVSDNFRDKYLQYEENLIITKQKEKLSRRFLPNSMLMMKKDSFLDMKQIFKISSTSPKIMWDKLKQNTEERRQKYIRKDRRDSRKMEEG